MTRKSGKHQHATYGTVVLTLLGLISSAHRDLNPCRSNQQPHYAEAETLPLGNRFISHISDAELTSHFLMLTLCGFITLAWEDVAPGVAVSSVGNTHLQNTLGQVVAHCHHD